MLMPHVHHLSLKTNPKHTPMKPSNGPQMEVTELTPEGLSVVGARHTCSCPQSNGHLWLLAALFEEPDSHTFSTHHQLSPTSFQINVRWGGVVHIKCLLPIKINLEKMASVTSL